MTDDEVLLHFSPGGQYRALRLDFHPSVGERILIQKAGDPPACVLITLKTEKPWYKDHLQFMAAYMLEIRAAMQKIDDFESGKELERLGGVA